MKAPIPIHKHLNHCRTALEAKLGESTGVFQDRSQLAIENSADILDTIQMATDRDVLAQRMNINSRILSDVRGRWTIWRMVIMGSVRTATN
jgi:hypothetical protein